MRCFGFLLLVLLAANPCVAQLLDDIKPEVKERYGETISGRFQVGAEITARRGACSKILTMVAVPLECEEQTVKIVEENFSSDVRKVTYRNIQGGARQMVISVPYLAEGATAQAIVTFEVSTKIITPPEEDEAALYVIAKRPPKNVRKFRSPSPYIESRHGQIRSLAKEIWKAAAEEENDWQKIERFYDYTLDNIKYIKGEDKSALTTLRDGEADCNGRSNVFIALCRAADIPARVVWVNNHCFPEFYLEDAEGNGRWFPAESAGTRAFGEMPLARVIMQKGDNFRIPERPKDRLRYATDFTIGLGGKPKVRYIREQL